MRWYLYVSRHENQGPRPKKAEEGSHSIMVSTSAQQGLPHHHSTLNLIIASRTQNMCSVQEPQITKIYILPPMGRVYSKRRGSRFYTFKDSGSKVRARHAVFGTSLNLCKYIRLKHRWQQGRDEETRSKAKACCRKASNSS